MVRVTFKPIFGTVGLFIRLNRGRHEKITSYTVADFFLFGL